MSPSSSGGIDTASPKSAGVYHIKGGYADTYIHYQSKVVHKYCECYYTDEEIHDTHIIHYSTICDLVFSKALSRLPGFPRIHSYEPADHRIRIQMDYLGKTLHDTSRTYSKQTRFLLAPRLLETLTVACLHLYTNGIQHTDIKPGNVLIDSRDQFHLIDFNCMSVLFSSSAWTSAIGTWGYVAPEILMTGKPHETSMTWSIGILMFYWLLGTYPISPERMARYIKNAPATTQSQWKNLSVQIRRKYPDILQLEQRYIHELGEWWPRLMALLHWNPYRRWSLERLLQSLYPLTFTHIPLIQSEPSLPDQVPDYIREKTLTLGFTFLSNIRRQELFVSTTRLFDRCYALAAPLDLSAPLLWLCAWTLRAYLTNQFVFDNDEVVLSIHQHFHISCDKILKYIYPVLQVCQYDIWEKEWTLYRRATPIQWDRVFQILLRQKAPYYPEDIARAYDTSVASAASAAAPAAASPTAPASPAAPASPTNRK
jgi:serine/threonine protein kinase